MKCWFSTHLDHVSISPTNGIGPTERQRKTLTRVIRVFAWQKRNPSSWDITRIEGANFDEGGNP